MTSGPSARPYEMRARQDAVDATRERILDAAVQSWLEQAYDDVTLSSIAERAGVARQTIFRQFGGKDEVFAAALAWAAERLDAQRELHPGNVPASVRDLLDLYEVIGDANVRSLQAEGRHPVIDAMLERGRAGHRAWLEAAFEPILPPPSEAARSEVLTALYAATDVTVWKLLRRDFALSRPDTERIVLRLVDGVLAGTSSEGGER